MEYRNEYLTIIMGDAGVGKSTIKNILTSGKSYFVTQKRIFQFFEFVHQSNINLDYIIRAHFGVIVVTNTSIMDVVQEYMRLAKISGLKEIVIIINKMDVVQWNVEEYVFIKTVLCNLNVPTDQITIIPMSAINNQNIFSHIGPNTCSWFGGNSFVEYLENCSTRHISTYQDDPFRMVVWQSYTNNGVCYLIGQVMSGSINSQDNIILMPIREKFKILQIQNYAGTIPKAKNGCVTIVVPLFHEMPIDYYKGCIVSHANFPIEVTEELVGYCKFNCLPSLNLRIISAGFKCECFCNGNTVEVNFVRLLAQKCKLSGIVIRNPAYTVVGLSHVIAYLNLSKPIGMTKYTTNKKLGRLLLLKNDSVIGYCKVSSLHKPVSLGELKRMCSNWPLCFSILDTKLSDSILCLYVMYLKKISVFCTVPLELLAYIVQHIISTYYYVR